MNFEEIIDAYLDGDPNLNREQCFDFFEENEGRVGLPVMNEGKMIEDSVVLSHDAPEVVFVMNDPQFKHCVVVCNIVCDLCFISAVSIPRECLKHFMPLILKDVRND